MSLPAEPEGTASARHGAGALARLAGAPWFAAVSALIAVVLVATAVVVWVAKFDPLAPQVQASQFAPSAFPTSIVASSSPAVVRGETVGLDIQSLAATEVASLELWDGDQLYYSTTEPTVNARSGLMLSSVHVDFAALTAGVHILSVRAIDQDGNVSVSNPLHVPVLDRPQDLGLTAASLEFGSGAPEAVTIVTSPGETLTTLAGRLVTAVGDLFFPGSTPTSFGAAPLTLTTALPAGLRVSAPIPRPSAVKEVGYGAITTRDWSRHLEASVNADCTVRVSLLGTTESLALYASTPLQPGFIRIGDVGPGGDFVSGSMPIGPSLLVAYPAGATSSNTRGDNGPTAPVGIIVPDDCASRGWSGTARIVNGVLLTEQTIVKPYAYVSIDKGTWQRVPARDGTFLPDGSISDVRSYLSLGNFDQVDIQVWSFDGNSAAQAAEGQFCRKSMENAQPSGSSGSGGECQPPGVAPGGGPRNWNADVTLTVALPLQDAIDSISEVSNAVSYGLWGDSPPAAQASAAIETDPNVSQTARMDYDQPVRLDISTTGTDVIGGLVQFSYFPISASSTAVSPSGVFHSIPLNFSPGQPASVSIDPWKWRNAKQSTESSSTFVGAGQDLVLNDELALALAKANLTAGKNLINTIYVRVVATKFSGYFGESPPPFASLNVKIDMTDTSSYRALDTVSAAVVAGIDQTAQDSALRHKCFTVEGYPEKNIWTSYPFAGPGTIPTLSGNEGGSFVTVEKAGDQYFSDYELALRQFPDLSVIHCLDPQADVLRQAAADAAAAKAADCGFFCYLTAVFIGAVVGFVAGGPAGLVLGALAGAAFAGQYGEIAFSIYNALRQLWDLVAATYNMVYSSINGLVASLNPICLAASAASSDAQATCEAISRSVQSAVVTNLTGLPPSLPTSDVLEQLASGEIEGAVEVAIEAGLGALGVGVTCDDLTVSGAAADGIDLAAGQFGGQYTQNALDSAKTEEGFSLCRGVARLAIATAKKQLDGFYTPIMRQGLETGMPSGTNVRPLVDTSPRVLVSGTSTQSVPEGSICPVYVNTTLTMPLLPPGGTVAALTEFTMRPLSGVMTATVRPDGSTSWSGSIPIPVVPAQNGFVGSLLLGSQKVATDQGPYIKALVDSPCFTNSLEVTASEYPDDSANGFAGLYFDVAYSYGDRPVSYYH